MLLDFFRLNAPFAEFDEQKLKDHLRVSKDLRSVLYKPDKWISVQSRFKQLSFSNVSFSKTDFLEVTFTECSFEDCLFIGARFTRTAFHRCRFLNCNFYKSAFHDCYIDPATLSFDRIYRSKVSNVGVDTYQKLYENSVATGQIDFARTADFEFRRWKRWQLGYDRKIGKIGRFDSATKYVASAAYEWLAGYGYRPSRFVVATLLLFTAVSILNRVVLSDALMRDGVRVGELGWPDAIFYTYSMMTVLGFSTIVPLTALAKLLAVLEALLGVGWLGIFTSLLVKRFIR